MEIVQEAIQLKNLHTVILHNTDVVIQTRRNRYSALEWTNRFLYF